MLINQSIFEIQPIYFLLDGQGYTTFPDKSRSYEVMKHLYIKGAIAKRRSETLQAAERVNIVIDIGR